MTLEQGAPSHLEAPPVANLAVEVQVQLHHQEAVLCPGEARRAATIRRRHIAGAVEMAEVVMSCVEAGTVRLHPHQAEQMHVCLCGLRPLLTFPAIA